MADAVAEAHEAHAAARCDLEGSARAFLNETALPAVRARNGAGAPTLLPAMHRIVNAVRPGLISPEAALYGHWMEWRESNRSGRPLSTGDTLRLTGAGSAMSLRSSARALLHPLRTRYPGDAAPYLNQARATYPGGVSELDAALHLLHPPDEDLGVGEVTVFVEGADEASARPRPTNPVYDSTRPTPPYAVVYEAFPKEPTWCPALPPATHAPRGWANRDLSPPLSRTRGAHHRGQVLWQECPGTPLLLLVVATRGEPGRILGITPTHLYGATPVPRPPLPAPAARDGVHAFLRTQEVTADTGVHLVRLPPTPLDDPRGPRALGPAPDWELWRDAWAAWLPRLPSQCRWMAIGPRPCGADATAGPPPSPPPPPPRRAPHGTAHGTALMHQEVVGGAHLPPRMPTRVTVMADSDGSPQRDDRHHRRSRSRSPVSSPEWTGETLAEREERRLAEAAVLVGPPPPAREPGPAETAAPAAQAASPAAPPRPDAQEAETASSHAAAPTAAPGTPPTRGAAPAQEPGASPRAAAAAEESKKGARGVATHPARAAGASPAAAAATEENEEGVRGVAKENEEGARGAAAATPTATADHAAAPSTPRKRGADPARATGASSAAATTAKESEEGARGAAAATPAGRDTASAGHAATPSTPRKRGKNPARAADASPAAVAAAAVGRESAKYRTHANPTHTHTSPPKPFPPKPFPPGRERHVRPPTRERSPPGVTLPQLQRQRDARRVVQEGRSSGGEQSAGSGRRDRQGAGEGPGHGKGAQGRGQGARVQGAGRGEVGERAGQGVGDGRRDPRHGQGAGERPGHRKGAQGRGQGAQAQGAGRGEVGERAGRGVGDGRLDPRHGQAAGKGPKGKGKGAAGPKGQAGRGMGAQGGGRDGGRGAEGGAPPQRDVQSVRCIPPGIQQMPAHHTHHHHHHHHHHLYNIDPDASELVPPQPPRHQHHQAPPAPRAEPARMASAEGGRGAAPAPQAQGQRGGPARGAEEGRPWDRDWGAVLDPLGEETLPLVGEVYGWLCWANQGTSRRSRNRPFDAVLLRRHGGNREVPPGGWAAPKDHERVSRSVIRAAWPDREPTWPALLEGGAVLRITDADANNWLPRALRSALAHWRYRQHNPPPPQPQHPHKRRRR